MKQTKTRLTTGPFIAGSRNDVCRVLVCDIVANFRVSVSTTTPGKPPSRLYRNSKDSHGQSVLIEAVAYFTAEKLEIWAPVHKTLRVVHVSVACSTSECLGAVGVLQVNEDEARPAVTCAWLSTDCHGVFALLVDNDIVCAADGEIVPPARNILVGVKGKWAFGIKIKQLAQLPN